MGSSGSKVAESHTLTDIITYGYQSSSGSKVAESHTLTDTDIHVGIRVAVD